MCRSSLRDQHTEPGVEGPNRCPPECPGSHFAACSECRQETVVQTMVACLASSESA